MRNKVLLQWEVTKPRKNFLAYGLFAALARTLLGIGILILVYFIFFQGVLTNNSSWDIQKSLFIGIYALLIITFLIDTWFKYRPESTVKYVLTTKEILIIPLIKNKKMRPVFEKIFKPLIIYERFRVGLAIEKFASLPHCTYYTAISHYQLRPDGSINIYPLINFRKVLVPEGNADQVIKILKEKVSN